MSVMPSLMYALWCREKMRTESRAPQCAICAWAAEHHLLTPATALLTSITAPLRCGGCSGTGVVRWYHCTYTWQESSGLWNNCGGWSKNAAKIQRAVEFSARRNGRVLSTAEATRPCTDCIGIAHRHSRRAKKLFRTAMGY